MVQHAESTSWERDLRSTRDLGELDAEAVPQTVKKASNDPFWLGVGPADVRRVRAPLFGCQPIRHAGDKGRSSRMFTVLKYPIASPWADRLPVLPGPD